MIVASPASMKLLFLVTGAALICLSSESVLADSSRTPHSLLAIEKIRERTMTQIRPQRIEVKANCLAHSMTPNQVENYWVTWDGLCVDGYAHGNGVKRTKAGGRPLSAQQGQYNQGVWTSNDEYVISLGRLMHVTKTPTGLPERTEVSPKQLQNLPLWTSELLIELPQAREEWAADLIYRSNERDRILNEIGVVNTNDADETGDEAVPPGATDLFASEE